MLRDHKLICFLDKRSNFVDFQRFSNWPRLIRHVKKVLEFVLRCKKQIISEPELHEKAELVCVSLSQSISFNEEYLCLKAHKPINKESRLLSSSTPFLDSTDVIQIDSRITYFNHLNLSNTPIFLDATEQYTVLLMKQYYEKFFHASHETILNELRQKYWILGLRNAMKKIVVRYVNFYAVNHHNPAWLHY